MEALEESIRRLTRADASPLPMPGAGHTPERLSQLFDWGVADLSFARIAEAHTDALAILAECAHAPRPGALYGVWASDAPPSRVTCHQESDGKWCLEGVKQFCSGADFVDAALITAHGDGGVLLFDVSMQDSRVTVQPSAWASPAFADTATTAVRLDAVRVPDADRLGEPGWYLQRPGFWHGSLGPAACWAGGAQSLIDAAVAANRKDAHSRAHAGALLATSWGLRAILDQAGRQIDADPVSSGAAARIRALKVRHLVERMCAETLDRFGRATGPHLLAYDPHMIRQHAALTLYIRQCHGERDLEGILET